MATGLVCTRCCTTDFTERALCRRALVRSFARASPSCGILTLSPLRLGWRARSPTCGRLRNDHHLPERRLRRVCICLARHLVPSAYKDSDDYSGLRLAVGSRDAVAALGARGVLPQPPVDALCMEDVAAREAHHIFVVLKLAEADHAAHVGIQRAVIVRSTWSIHTVTTLWLS